MNDSLIKDIGRSYIVSSLLPASLFVLLAVVIFKDFLPPLADLQTQTETVVISSGVFVLAFTMWIAFALYSSVDFVIKFFEGYYFPFFMAIPLKWLHYQWQRWKLRHLLAYEKAAAEIRVRPRKRDRTKGWRELAQKIPDVEEQLREREIVGPLQDNWRAFMPTRLGNILLASEIYPYERYQLDGPNLFPRMSMAFPPEFVAALEEKNNQMVFLLNSSLLALATGVIALVLSWAGTSGFQFVNRILPVDASAYFAQGYSSIPPAGYRLIGQVFLAVAYLIYAVSINAVKEYALFIRTSFDLYRFHLLRELNYPIPSSLENEKQVWVALNQFILAGEKLGEKAFTYQLKPELIATTVEKENKK